MARAHLFGTPVSPGIAIGRLHFLHMEPLPEKRRVSPEEAEGEKAALRAALDAVRLDLTQAADRVPDEMREYRDVIAAQIEMTRDPKIGESACRLIDREGVCAAWALHSVVSQMCELFRGLDDPYLRDRAQDVRVVGLRVLNRLAGSARQTDSGESVILAAQDISPADVMDLDMHAVRGIITLEGGVTSHTAILARGMHIPALVSVTNLTSAASEGDEVIIDGLSGNVLIAPDSKDTGDFSLRAGDYAAWQESARRTARWPADTRDALRVLVLANIERPKEAAELASFGADGIGLYRTEFAFLKDKLPDEEELVREYAAVIRDAPGSTVFRTLDCGADKLLRAQESIREPNPALGLRGIRFALRNQDLFRIQLRALLRAGREGEMSILLPMICTVEEVRETRRLIQEVAQELSLRGVPHAESVPLGVMIETPAAVLLTDALAVECDFFSIGTNDLIHYLMAIDRNNRHVAYLNEAMHPAVIRSLKRIIDSAHREGLSVSACGELSSDPFGVVLMLGMGIDALSVSPAFLPGIKHLIRKLDAQACTDLASQVLMSTDIPACKHMVNELLQKVLGHELTFLSSAVMGTAS